VQCAKDRGKVALTIKSFSILVKLSPYLLRLAEQKVMEMWVILYWL